MHVDFNSSSWFAKVLGCSLGVNPVAMEGFLDAGLFLTSESTLMQVHEVPGLPSCTHQALTWLHMLKILCLPFSKRRSNGW